MIIMLLLSILFILIWIVWFFIYWKIKLDTIKMFLFFIVSLILVIWFYFTFEYWNIINNYLIFLWNFLFLTLIIWIILTLIELNENYKITDNNKLKWKEINTTDDLETFNQIKEKNILLVIKFSNLMLLLFIVLFFIK